MPSLTLRTMPPGPRSIKNAQLCCAIIGPRARRLAPPRSTTSPASLASLGLHMLPFGSQCWLGLRLGSACASRASHNSFALNRSSGRPPVRPVVCLGLFRTSRSEGEYGQWIAYVHRTSGLASTVSLRTIDCIHSILLLICIY